MTRRKQGQTTFFLVLALAMSMSAMAKHGAKTAAFAATATAATAAAVSSSSGGGAVRAGGSGTTGLRPFVDPRNAPPVDPKRTVNEVDCTKPVDFSAGNLKCK